MFPLLYGSGIVAHEEGALIIEATLLMLIVIVPVLFLLYFFAWRYRASNTKAKYTPNWEHSKFDELIWWAVPFEIVLVLAAIIWQSSHALAPSAALASNNPAMVIETVALPSAWLFIYPAQGIATVNELEVPVGVPLRFEITADAPMNSLWIPALGGQIYAMTGMVNPLNLMADSPGDYQGMSSNYSGDGFADMHFMVHAVAQKNFNAWVANVKATPGSVLNLQHYDMLRDMGAVQPGYWSTVDPTLFTSIVSPFDAMAPMVHD